MKKRYRAITAVLLVTMTFATVFLSVSSCGKEGEDTPSPESNVISLQRFESFFDMFNCSFAEFLGKVDLVPEHRTEGEFCARIDVQKLLNGFIPGVMKIPAVSARYGYDASSLSDIDYFGFSLYNGNDFTATVTFTAATVSGAALMAEKCELAPGTGKTFRFSVNRTAAFLRDEPVYTYDFTFGTGEGIWYLDAIYAETALTALPDVSRSFGSGTLLSFDDADDLDYIDGGAGYVPEAFEKTVTLSGSGNFVKGKGALSVAFSAAEGISQDETIQLTGRKSGFGLTRAFLNACDLTGLSGGGRLSVDIYNRSDRVQRVLVTLTDETNITVTKAVNLAPREWTAVSVGKEDIGASRIGLSKLSVLSYQFYLNLMHTDGAAFYIDELRLEEALS